MRIHSELNLDIVIEIRKFFIIHNYHLIKINNVITLNFL